MIDNNRVELGDSEELVVTLRSGYDTTFKITHWRDGLQFFTLDDDEWSLEDADAGLFLASEQDNYESEQRDAVDRFVAGIPKNVRQTVSFFNYKQFSLLRLAAQYPELEAVLLHSPNLCWLVVCFAEQANWSTSQIAQVLQLKRSRIVELLFDNNSEQLVKLVNKIELINGSEGESLLLFKILKNEQIISAFNHWKTVSIIALRIAHKRPFFINSKLLLNEVSNEKSTRHNLVRFGKFSETYNDLQRMYRALDRELDPRVWLAVKDDRQLRKLHDKCVTRYNQSERGRLEALLVLRDTPQHIRANAIANAEQSIIDEPLDIDFPICSIGDLPDLVQIKDSIELSQEGIFMNHCVGSYASKLRNEQSYIYKLLAPERATVEVKILGDKISVIQFKLANNKKPSPESYAYLREIITDYQSKINVNDG